MLEIELSEDITPFAIGEFGRDEFTESVVAVPSETLWWSSAAPVAPAPSMTLVHTDGFRRKPELMLNMDDTEPRPEWWPL